MTSRSGFRDFRLWPMAILVCVAIASSTRAETPRETRILVDFEQPATIQLHTIDATAQQIHRDRGNALEIVTGVNSNWPSVTIRPRSGQWNLSGFYAVEIDVHNPQDRSIRVLLSVRSPRAGGGDEENTESVTVPAGGQATLQVPFGSWHGETNRPIDQSNIVSATVLLDRPERLRRFVVDDLRAVPFGSRVSEELMATEFFHQLTPVLGRGVNLGNMLEAPREGQWGVRVEDEYFDLIQSAGFDSVRIPVRWSAHAAKQPPYTIDPAFLDRVEHVVQQAMSHRLRAVLNMHHYEEIFHQPDEQAARFCGMWGQIANRFKGYPETLYFELLNEPHDKLDADRWDRMAAEALAVLRKTNPTRKVVIGPADWNNVNALGSLVLPAGDPNVIGTFHYYLPFRFTHQGAGWVGQNANQWLGTKWTGTPGERQAVISDLDKALAWSVKHQRPIYLGEFGAYSKADMESRARWTRFIATEAAKRKIAFAYWEFCAGFGVYDPDQGAWREPLKDALLPQGE